MSHRVLIFDDDQNIRKILWALFDHMGYEVFTFPNPGLCPLAVEKCCPCPDGEACADVIISDVNMPVMDGFSFVGEQIEKGCRCPNIALMSGTLAEIHFEKAKEFGITLFQKPFRFQDIKKWVERIEKNIDPNRKLTNWYLNKIQKPNGNG